MARAAASRNARAVWNSGWSGSAREKYPGGDPARPAARSRSLGQGFAIAFASADHSAVAPLDLPPHAAAVIRAVRAQVRARRGRRMAGESTPPRAEWQFSNAGRARSALRAAAARSLRVQLADLVDAR